MEIESDRSAGKATSAGEGSPDASPICRAYCEATGALLDSEPFCAALSPLLQEAMATTGSAFGLVCAASPGGLRIIGAEANDAERKEEAPFWSNVTKGLGRDGYYDLQGRDGVLAVPFHNADVVIINGNVSDTRYAMMPGRASSLKSFLGVPLRRGQETVGLFAIANSADSYAAETVEQLAPLILAAAIMCVTHRMDEQLAQLEAHLVEARRLESLGKLAGGVAHEFNNVLQVMLSGTDALLRDLPSTNPRYDDVEVMHRTAERGMLLSRQLLGYTTSRGDEVCDVNLNLLLEEMGTLLDQMIRDDIRVVMLLDPALGVTQVDRALIQQVIVDLAAAASAAMPHGGRLTFRTANLNLEEHGAGSRPPGVAAGGYVVFSVSDSGVGHYADSIAGVHHASGKTANGGVESVRGIVRQFGGELVSETVTGGGTRVTMYLPRVTDDAVTQILEPEESEPVLGPNAAKGETILLAEDEEAVRNLTQRVLERHNYRVLTATNGVEALQVAAAHDGPIDLLLTDVIMPEMGGKDLAQRLFVTHPDVAVVYMSGYTGTAIQRAGVRRLGSFYLQKPFRSPDLLRMLRAALDRTPPSHA